MIITDGLSELNNDIATKVAIGKFDGVHIGHQELIKTMCSEKDDLKSCVFTFSRATNNPYISTQRILNDEEKRARFEGLGVDYLIEYDLNDISSKEEPEDFAKNVLKNRLHVKKIFCGPDLSFGYKGRGNIELLKSMEKELDIEVVVIDKVRYQGEEVSSSRIRDAILSGDMINANKMLGK